MAAVLACFVKKNIRIFFLLVYLSAFSLSLVPSSAAADAHPDALSELMSQWLGLEQQRNKLEADWALRSVELKNRLALYEAEEAALKEMIESVNTSQDQLDARRAGLTEEQRRFEIAQDELDRQLAHSLATLQQLLPRLPPPLQQQWQPQLAQMAKAAMTNSQKLEKVLTLLKTAEEFNERVALHETPMLLEGSNGPETVMVTQLYLGLAQGWYVDDSGRFYGAGRPLAEAWHWWHQESADRELEQRLNPDDLLRLRSMLRNPTKAELMAVPVKLDGSPL